MAYSLEKLVLLDLVTTVSVTSCTATVAQNEELKTKMKFHHPAKKKDHHHLKATKEEKYEKKKTSQRNLASETKTGARLSPAVRQNADNRSFHSF